MYLEPYYIYFHLFPPWSSTKRYFPLQEQDDHYSCDVDGQLSWADGILLVYSVTDRCSFDAAASFARRLQSTGPAADQPAAHRRRFKHFSGDSCSQESDESSSDESCCSIIAADNSAATFSSRLRPCVVVVGNKSDLATERRVSEPEGAELASKLLSDAASDLNVELNTNLHPSQNNNNDIAFSASTKAFVETSARDGGPEIAAAFEAVCRHVLEGRRRRRASTSSGQRSPTDVPASLRGSSQSLATVDCPNKRRFVRRMVLLQAVNRFVRKLHV